MLLCQSYLKKKKTNVAFCDDSNETGGHMLSELSYTEKQNTVWYHLYVEAEKKLSW